MCGRFVRSRPAAEYAALFGAEPVAALPPSWNVAPGQAVLAVRQGGGAARELVALRWGYVPPWARDPRRGPRPINARAETAARSRLFGDALISTPFCVYGGAIGEPLACTALEEEACRLAEDLGVDYLELRHLERRHPTWPARDDLYVTFRKALHPDPERNLAAVPRKQRAMIRKGEQAGLHAVEERGVDRFFRVYSESVRNLGTPVFPKRWFRALREVFGEACSVLTVYRGAEPVASVMSFHFRDEVLPYYGGGTRAARALRANDYMYWEVMRRACQRGARVFDYGRSKVGTGSYRFKKHWGFEPQPLHYEYHLVKARRVPDLNPLNPKYRAAAAVWKRLPLPLTRILGPMIARSLG